MIISCSQGMTAAIVLDERLGRVMKLHGTRCGAPGPNPSNSLLRSWTGSPSERGP